MDFGEIVLCDFGRLTVELSLDKLLNLKEL